MTALTPLCGLALAACGSSGSKPDATGAGGSGGADAGGAGGAAMIQPNPKYGAIDVKPVECLAAAAAGAITFDKIAVWRDDAKSAYTMIHDDMCGPALRGIDRFVVPTLALRNLTAGLGPFVSACEQGQLWSIVTDAESKGNEICNHSYTHSDVTPANAAKEIVMAKQIFDGKLVSPASFYIFPYDYFTAETVAAVGAAGHLGARAGSRDTFNGGDNPPLNPVEPGKDLELVFDVWPRSYSKYALYQPRDILNIHVHRAIELGTFAVREMHSVSDRELAATDASAGFGPVPLPVYEDHLDLLVQAWKKNLVWTSTPSTIIRYRHARTACKASVTGTTISFDTTNPDCAKFATPVSVIVKTENDVPGLKAVQMTKPVFTRKIAAGTFSVTANPMLGDVALEGCATPSSTVDAALPMPAKPTPVNSVCDIETVKGKGMPGNMDNFQRGTAQLQALPNPAQGDLRTGSWSWSPQTLPVEIVIEPGNNGVLRFSGMNLNAWANMSLAFLGGDGAGSCYDASAYKGVRFKVKGRVAAPDAMNGLLILSLITAETQPQNYGGDLKGEGGHFAKPIMLTPAWQTVSIPWTDLAKPTFGDTASLPAPALTKMQALNFGVVNTATDFEVFLDDIELY